MIANIFLLNSCRNIYMFERDYEYFFAFEEKLRRKIFQWVPDESSGLLDIGCKRGNITRRYLNKTKKVIGIDKDPVALAAAKQDCQEIRLLAGRTEELPFKAGSFNILIISEVLQYVTDAQRAIMDIYRVARPDDGLLIISVPQKGFFYQYIKPGYAVRLFLDRQKPRSVSPRSIHFTLSGLARLLKGKFVIEEVYRGGTIFYPYLSKILRLLVDCAVRGHRYGEDKIKSDILKRIYLKLLVVFYTASSWIVKQMMKIDFSLRLGRYSFNIVLMARRE